VYSCTAVQDQCSTVALKYCITSLLVYPSTIHGYCIGILYDAILRVHVVYYRGYRIDFFCKHKLHIRHTTLLPSFVPHISLPFFALLSSLPVPCFSCCPFFTILTTFLFLAMSSISMANKELRTMVNGGWFVDVTRMKMLRQLRRYKTSKYASTQPCRPIQ
jgi:hypothetical protein